VLLATRSLGSAFHWHPRFEKPFIGSIAAWIAFYNLRRPHQALANRTPMAVWRGGVTGALGDTAVDMTLVLRTSLDNAGALPTCPQPPQPQQEALIA